MKAQSQYTLDEGAVFLHELFQAYRRAGFTEDQAMFIVIETMKEQLALTHSEGKRDATT